MHVVALLLLQIAGPLQAAGQQAQRQLLMQRCPPSLCVTSKAPTWSTAADRRESMGGSTPRDTIRFKWASWDAVGRQAGSQAIRQGSGVDTTKASKAEQYYCATLAVTSVSTALAKAVK
jgi:hypothetical protein